MLVMMANARGWSKEWWYQLVDQPETSLAGMEPGPPGESPDLLTGLESTTGIESHGRWCRRRASAWPFDAIIRDGSEIECSGDNAAACSGACREWLFRPAEQPEAPLAGMLSGWQIPRPGFWHQECCLPSAPDHPNQRAAGVAASLHPVARSGG